MRCFRFYAINQILLANNCVYYYIYFNFVGFCINNNSLLFQLNYKGIISQLQVVHILITCTIKLLVLYFTENNRGQCLPLTPPFECRVIAKTKVYFYF